MAKWDINKLKEIICPQGLACSSFDWMSQHTYFFEIPGTPTEEYFCQFSEDTNIIVVFPIYGDVVGSKTCSINEIRFDLKSYAENYVKTYKEFMINQKKLNLEKDFVNG